MTQLILSAEQRTASRKQNRGLREQGLVPGILYGNQFEPIKLQFNGQALERILKTAGTSTLISIEIGKEKYNALVRDTQRDPLRRNLLHVDMMQVAMDVTVRTEVSLLVVGEAPIGTMLMQELDSMEIECLPGQLPSSIQVDVSSLIKPGDTLTMADIHPPEGVTVLSDHDLLIVRLADALSAEEIEEEEEEILLDDDVPLVEEETDEAEF